MTKIFFIIAGLAAFAYWQRYGFRRSWYVLRTGDLDPDFESLNSEYFLGIKAKKSEDKSQQQEST